MELIRILVVDDSKLMLTAVRRLLRDMLGRVEIGEAQDGAAALALFTQNAWDVVVLDLSMPDESGLVVLDKLLQKNPRLPVVIMSTDATPSSVEHSFGRGALGFVAKEDTPEELVPAIMAALSGHFYRSRNAAQEDSIHRNTASRW